MTRSLAVSAKFATNRTGVRLLWRFRGRRAAVQRLYNVCTTFVHRMYNVCTTYVQRVYNVKQYVEHYFEHYVEHNCDYIYRVYESIFIGSPRGVMD